MSLIQFLQQSILKDISHQILQQIQKEHSATESLLDMLSSMRNFERLPIISNRLNTAKIYVEIKEDIYKSLNGLDYNYLHKWMDTIFKENSVVAELAKIEKNQIENVIISTLKEVFIFDRASINEQEYERQLLTQYIHLLTELQNKEQSNIKPNKQEISQLARLDEKYIEFKYRFDNQVNMFNKKLKDYIIQLKNYDEKIRREFRGIFNVETNGSMSGSSFKIMERSQGEKDQFSNYYQQYSDFSNNKIRINAVERYQLPVRDIYDPL